jgi:transposase
MLNLPDRNGSFYDADQVCDRLVPPDSFYRKFRELVVPLIQDDQFESMYCKNDGRPCIPPSLLALATIIQFHKNLSDRDMERACMFDIEVKFALGLRLDERPFDHSSLGDFRKRLLQAGKEKEIFDRILSCLIEGGLIEKNEIQRIDATHVIADIAIPTMVTMVKKGIFEILKPLQKRNREVVDAIGREVDLAEYRKETVNKECPGRHDMESKKRKLVDVVGDARKVLAHTEGIGGDPILSRRVEMLKRILRENIEEDDEGHPRERARKEKPKNILVSPIDPDARYGAKSKTKQFTGYKANVTETVNSRFITNIKAMPGNRPDGETTVEAVVEQQAYGLIPAKLIGDTAYGDGKYRMMLRENGTKMVAPLRTPNNITKSVFPKSMFAYDRERNVLTCPEGVEANQTFMDRKKNIRMFHFPMSSCDGCLRQEECTNAKEGRRTVGISEFNEDLREAEIFNKTEQFAAEMKLRQAVEGKLSELVRYHGLRRARYRGIAKVAMQFYFTAAAVNVKRWIKLIREKWKPKGLEPIPVPG